MYALIHKDKVLSGPRSWNRAFFEYILTSNKIDVDTVIPRTPVDVLPYVIDQDTKIMAAQVVQEPLNPLIQYYRGPTWELTADAAIANYEILYCPLDSAKYNIKQVVAAKRYVKEIAGATATIQNTEVTIDTTRDGRNVFVQKYILMADTDTVNWKFPECWLTLTKQELKDVITVGETHIQDSFNWEKELNDQIDLCEDYDALVVIEESLKETPQLGQQISG
jgi:hypothetical protein